MKNWKLLSNSKKFTTQKQLIDQLLKNRGIDEKEKKNYFDPKLSDVTAALVGLNKKEIAKTINRIKSAIANNEKIIIFGDYDVDGICGTAILWEALYALSKNVFPYIPHRVDEGYGLSIKGIENIIKKYPDVKIIITIDNGIVAYDAALFAKNKNIDVIITDHHVKNETLPENFAIVHTTKLCGAGIAYLLAQEIKYQTSSIRTSQGEKIKYDYKEDRHLELVAIATICDLVPLKEANRTLVKFGLEKLKMTRRLGLLELFKEAGITNKTIGTYEIGHIIGPRINAMGRLEHGFDSLRLLCTLNTQKAEQFAAKLSITNRIRREILEETTIDAKTYFENGGGNSRIIIVANELYNQGVIGLVASRLVETYYRPSFVLSIGEQYSKGSARSIHGVNIIELIRSVSDTLVQAGGHPMAAGFTVETKRLAEFKKALEEKAREVVTDDHLIRTLLIDGQAPFELINDSLYQELSLFKPFGMGNPEPTFVTYSAEITDVKFLGKDNKHLKLKLQNENLNLSAIAFGFGVNCTLKIGDKIDVVYTVDENVWNGKTELQLKIKDIKTN